MGREPRVPLYVLGGVDWLTTQTLYHGLAELDEEAIILCWPKSPYVSLGCHQDGAEFDPVSGIPALRRRVGGTLVYLDEQQVFFQVLMDPSRLLPGARPSEWYRLALEPVVAYLDRLGLEARLKPPADILIGSRKISGNAGGQLGDKMVIVGNLLVDFPRHRMAEARYAPNPEMRRAFEASLNQHLVTLHELPGLAGMTRETVMEGLAETYILGLNAVLSEPAWTRWSPTLERIGRELQDPRWLRAEGYRLPYHQIKIRESVYLRALRVDPAHPWAPLTVELHTDSRTVTRVWGVEELERMDWPRSIDHLHELPMSPDWLEALCRLADRPPGQHEGLTKEENDYGVETDGTMARSG